MRALTWLAGGWRALQRLALALKYFNQLGYSWHLAWQKAGR